MKRIKVEALNSNIPPHFGEWLTLICSKVSFSNKESKSGFQYGELLVEDKTGQHKIYLYGCNYNVFKKICDSAEKLELMGK